MESLRGKLLVSGGALFDPNFRQTVVLLGEHDERGAVGVVLNRRMEVSVAAAVPALAGLVEPGALLFEGGPVEPAQPVLLAEMAEATAVDVPVFGSIGFLTGAVPAGLGRSVKRARVFAGHSGWGAGQLEAEFAEDAWIVAEATAEDVFTPDPAGLWRRVVRRLGPPHDALARIPFDPQTN